MSRPGAQILLTTTDRTFGVHEILAAKYVFAIYLDGTPIAIRFNTLRGSRKYRRCTFTSPGQARNLWRKLRKLYPGHSFSVMKLLDGEDVTPEPS